PATCGSVCPEAERGFLAGHVAGPRIGPGTPPVGPSAPSVAAEAFGNRADGGVLSRCGRLVIAAAGALDLGLQVIGKGDGAAFGRRPARGLPRDGNARGRRGQIVVHRWGGAALGWTRRRRRTWRGSGGRCCHRG